MASNYSQYFSGIQTPTTTTRPTPGALQPTTFRNILRAAVHRILSKSRFKDNHTWSSPTGGNVIDINLSDNQSLSLQVLTKDSVTVSVDAVVYYRVSNATVSVANVENAHHSTR